MKIIIGSQDHKIEYVRADDDYVILLEGCEFFVKSVSIFGEFCEIFEFSSSSFFKEEDEAI